jgi:hypothetical protein
MYRRQRRHLHILWWSNLEILVGPLHRSSPFIGERRCQAIQTVHGPYITERTQKAVYIVRCLWIQYSSLQIRICEESLGVFFVLKPYKLHKGQKVIYMITCPYRNILFSVRPYLKGRVSPVFRPLVFFLV